MNSRILTSMVATLAIGASAAEAASRNHDDALSGPLSTITITRAIAAAEAHVGGSARRAEYEKTAQGWAYDVEVAKGGQVFDVAVDPHQGKVIRSTQDAVDQDDGNDRAD